MRLAFALTVSDAWDAGVPDGATAGHLLADADRMLLERNLQYIHD
ncbi:hypothetical protein [Kitasatospora paranensis]|uniref:Uncharacterized protein n=1 Tax=Kitasatospora paranensis TaxID=258053 RepID=A0ABW2GBK8_9ACTN